jgi:DNA-binding beta-propeller fold protein YncE
MGEIGGSRDLKAGRTGLENLKAAFRGPLPPIPFSSPHGIAIRDGRFVAVADGTGGAVHVLDLHERSHRQISGFHDTRLVSPMGVAWNHDRLLITDAGLGEVFELTAAGELLYRHRSPELVRPVGIVYSLDHDRFYVADAGGHRLCSGEPGPGDVQCTGVRGAESGAFNFPTHLALADDYLWVADTGNFRIQKLDVDSHFVSAFGRKGDAAGDMSLPKGVALDRDGHVYVVDAHFENVQVFDQAGRLLMAFGEPGSGPGQFSLPAGIAIDSLDRIWVADSGNRRVQVFQYLRNAS